MALIVIMTFFSLKKEKDIIIAFLALAGASAFRLIPSANRILVAYQYLGFAKKSLSLINQELKNNSLNNINKKRQIDFQNKIEFKNVSFKYKDRDSYVLKDVNLKINKSDKFLIYGETGSGKEYIY